MGSESIGRGMESRHEIALLTVACFLMLHAAAGHSTEASAAQATHEDRAVVSADLEYEIPDVQLVRDDGKRVSFRDEINDGRTVVLNFIFTNCSSFCPLSSQTFEAFQNRLGDAVSQVHLMSISIDPEQDTPARLRQYAHKFHAGPEWQHYTGTLEASLTAQRALGAYRGDKMSHVPLTLIRAPDGKTWRRIDGLVTPDELLNQYHQLLARRE